MDIIVCTASKNQGRLDGFMEEVNLSLFPFENLKIVVVDTIGNMKVETDSNCYRIVPDKLGDFFEPSTVMSKKFDAVDGMADDKSIVMMLDDDYSINPHALALSQQIMEENNEVNYLSLLRGPGVVNPDIINLSGWDFFQWPSCMGGSVIMRWSICRAHMQSFFFQKRGEAWDSVYWRFLASEFGIIKPVYTLADFSLMQHCNLVSSYVGRRGGLFDHMYGINFDPRLDPFIMRK
jgi:hypothetical protein